VGPPPSPTGTALLEQAALSSNRGAQAGRLRALGGVEVGEQIGEVDLEGYWGNSRLGRGFALIRTMHHRRRLLLLKELALDLDDAVSAARSPLASARLIGTSIVSLESQRLRGSYPRSLELTLPTRRGAPSRGPL
jgi:hypothetical protein